MRDFVRSLLFVIACSLGAWASHSGTAKFVCGMAVGANLIGMIRSIRRF